MGLSDYFGKYKDGDLIVKRVLQVIAGLFVAAVLASVVIHFIK